MRKPFARFLVVFALAVAVLMSLPIVARAEEKYFNGTRVTTVTAGPYISGALFIGVAVTRCISQIREDCFFWTPLGCDGVSENPVFSLGAVNTYPYCEDDLACVYNTYCSGTCTAQCELIGPPRPPIDNCPIVIPLDQSARFTDLARGVQFDIDADGDPDRISWTDPRWETVFLALDRNGDGVINDGSELFGNYTEQPPSSEPNGFIALADFDAVPAGGNDDGVISGDDAAFADLRVWHDANHDGQSQVGELRSLAQSGIVEIDLRYRESRRRDQFGNHLRYQAKVELVDGRTKAIDVFFLGE